MARPLLLLGWSWPFVVAAGVVADIAAGGDGRSDPAMFLMFWLALAGSPAVAVTLAGRLPRWWPAPRLVVTLWLAAPVVLDELYLAALVLAVGAAAAGPGWITE